MNTSAIIRTTFITRFNDISLFINGVAHLRDKVMYIYESPVANYLIKY